jgi:ADP-L-glycero-D-manno-heptose 6-epimerase
MRLGGRGRVIVVTGGAGFIGSNIVAGFEAEERGRILVSDRLETPEKRRNLSKRRHTRRVDPDVLFDELGANEGDISALIHMGAISSTTETDETLLVETNVRLSQRLWEWCVRHEKPFLYASSAATYGDGSAGFDDDGSKDALTRLKPLNLYGRSKHAFDLWVAEQVEGGFACPPQWIGFKFFNVYGPNEYHKGDMRSLVAKSFAHVSAGKPVTLFRSHRSDVPDGGQSRDFIYVDDCVRVVTWLLDHSAVSGLFNLGTGRARSFHSLIRAVHAALDREVQIEWVDTPEGIRSRYQYFTEARMDRLVEAGYRTPFQSVEEGVRQYVREFLSTDDIHR